MSGRGGRLRLLPLLVVLAAAWAGLSMPTAGGAAAAAEQGPDDAALFTADGYRRAEIKTPTPDSVPGATVIHTAELAELMAKGPVGLIDVMPGTIRPPDLPPDRLWMPTPRLDIPGSLWLPGTGLPVLSDALAAYFADGLRQATGGDLGAPVVIYCQPNCWLSWNAAKRAATLGYRRVLWYPDGSDGWAAAGHPTARAEAVPMRGAAAAETPAAGR